jgi:hypothetical protein
VAVELQDPAQRPSHAVIVVDDEDEEESMVQETILTTL